jgi:hypothetical protein
MWSVYLSVCLSICLSVYLSPCEHSGMGLADAGLKSNPSSVHGGFCGGQCGTGTGLLSALRFIRHCHSTVMLGHTGQRDKRAKPGNPRTKQRTLFRISGARCREVLPRWFECGCVDDVVSLNMTLLSQFAFPAFPALVGELCEIAAAGRKLLVKVLHSLYCSLNVISARLAGHVAVTVSTLSVFCFLVP